MLKANPKQNKDRINSQPAGYITLVQPRFVYTHTIGNQWKGISMDRPSSDGRYFQMLLHLSGGALTGQGSDEGQPDPQQAFFRQVVKLHADDDSH